MNSFMIDEKKQIDVHAEWDAHRTRYASILFCYIVHFNEKESLLSCNFCVFFYSFTDSGDSKLTQLHRTFEAYVFENLDLGATFAWR